MDAKEEIFNEGVRLFNAEEFYEAHEKWEKIWLWERGSDRLFYQGLIVLAGSFHHAKKGRTLPAGKALTKGLEKLASYPAHHLGIDLGKLRFEAAVWVKSKPFPKIS